MDLPHVHKFIPGLGLPSITYIRVLSLAAIINGEIIWDTKPGSNLLEPHLEDPSASPAFLAEIGWHHSYPIKILVDESTYCRYTTEWHGHAFTGKPLAWDEYPIQYNYLSEERERSRQGHLTTCDQVLISDAIKAFIDNPMPYSYCISSSTCSSSGSVSTSSNSGIHPTYPVRPYARAIQAASNCVVTASP